jgi:guanylate kinase
MVGNIISFPERSLRNLFLRVNLLNILNVSQHFTLLILVSSNYYGTTIGAVEAVAQTGKKCILDIEMEVKTFLATADFRGSRT